MEQAFWPVVLGGTVPLAPGSELLPRLRLAPVRPGPSRFRSAHLGRGPFRHVGQQIVVGQFVIARPRRLDVGSQFLSAEHRTFLNADAVLQEQHHVDADQEPRGGFIRGFAIELIDAPALRLIKT
ncbi:MAG: hypothetical protein ABSH40_19240 [Bryobacteraceae bacterium]